MKPLQNERSLMKVLLVKVLLLAMSASLLGCDVLFGSPALEKSEEVERVAEVTPEPERVVEIKAELCTQTAGLRLDVLSRQSVADWIAGQPIADAIDISATLLAAAQLFTITQSELSISEEENTDLGNLRNAAIELLDLYCNPDGHAGQHGKGCDLWQSHLAGQLSASQLHDEFTRDIRTMGVVVEYWDNYTHELTVWLFAYRSVTLYPGPEFAEFNRPQAVRDAISYVCASPQSEPIENGPPPQPEVEPVDN